MLKKNEIRELTLSDFKTYYKSVGRYINIELVYINIISIHANIYDHKSYEFGGLHN